jgi:hypothetical protein
VVDPEPLHLFKVPHFRNLYQKVGMFGMPSNTFFPFDAFAFMGDQVRGFGYIHDGSCDTVFRFHGTAGFTTAASPDGFPLDAAGDEQRRQVEAYFLAFDNNVAPIVGQQVTLTASNASIAGPRVALLESRADAGECDLVAQTWVGSLDLSFLYVGGGQFLTDHQGAPPVGDGWLRAFGAPLTYTCLPPGEGPRVALDRDGDGFYGGDEQDAGSDPGDPFSTP